MIRHMRMATAVVVPLVALVSCQGQSASTVKVTLQEWAVLAETASVPAGEVTFAVTNNGPDDVHEFVIVRTDLDPGALPTDETGAVEETGDGIEAVDEIEDIAVGSTEELKVTLEAGTYVLMCNVYSADEHESHYAMGMRTALKVEGT